MQGSSMLHAPLQRAALRPARPVSRAAALVVRASGSDGLQSWQVSKLQQAHAAGRRQVKVEKLCKEVGLPRGEVLQWLKDQPPLDRTQQSLIEARAAAEEAAAERQAVLRQPHRAPPSGGMPAPFAAGGASRPAAAGGGRAGSGGGGGTGPGGAPAWKSYAKKKHLGRQAEATLEMMYSRTQWPSDDAVSSLWELHRLPRQKVVDWFQQRRKEDQGRPGGKQQQQRRDNGSSEAADADGDGDAADGDEVASGSGGGQERSPRGRSGRERGSGGGRGSRSGGGSIDWDAEWQRQ